MNKIKTKVKELIDKFDKLLSYYKGTGTDFNEETCKSEFITPFFELLGWDMTNTKGVAPNLREVRYEYKISKFGNGTKRADYMMTLSGMPSYYVEAKKPGVNIVKVNKPAIQVREYGWSKKVPISVLTNFEYLTVYDTEIPPTATDDWNVAVLKVYHYTEFVDKFEEIYELLSRETIYSGKLKEVLNNRFGTGINKGLKLSVDKFFLNQMNKWRIDIGNHLLKAKGFNIDVINDSVQEITNQIVFLRICEDRKLPLYKTLGEIAKDKNTLFTELSKTLNEAEVKYGSGIFTGKDTFSNLSEEVIQDIIESLYYPKSPYEFSFISQDIIGGVYEMFLSEKLVINNTNEVVLIPKAKSTDKGSDRTIVTTPIEIVKTMVSKSLAPLCADKNPKEILSLKICDIACGSGMFLVEAYDYLVNYCINWYKSFNMKYLIVNQDGEYTLPIKDKREILTHCIHGIDIDINAVEVSKFNLILKFLEDETEASISGELGVLPNIEGNIILGNSLIDFDNINVAKLSQKDKFEILPLGWDSVNNGEKFDLIISAPPYVNTIDMQTLVPKEELKVYKSKYQTAYKQFDKYYIFLERALDKVKANGYVSLIIPNKFTKISSGTMLRKMITENNYLCEYTDFGSTQLLETKTIYSSIVLLQKKHQENFTYENVNNVYSWLSGDNSNSRAVFKSNVISEKLWALGETKEEMELIKSIYNNSQPLHSIAETFNGVQTSAEKNHIYWFSKDEIIREDDDYIEVLKFDKKYLIEKAVLKRYFKQVKKNEKGLSSYDIYDTDKYIIFPYDENGQVFPLDIMKSNFPNAMKYLQDRYDVLKPKQIDPTGVRDVPFATKDTWYRYGRHQGLTRFNNTTKLIVGVLTKKPMYLYDDKNLVVSTGGNAGYCGIVLNEDTPYSLEYIQAYLSHPTTEWLLSVIGSDFEGGFHSRGTHVLKDFPIKKIDFNNPEQVAIYNNIVESTRSIYDINEMIKGGVTRVQQSILYREKEILIKTIEEQITEIYKF